VTYETDVLGYGRKMGRYGGGNGLHMEDPHPYTDVTFNTTAVAIAGREHNDQMYNTNSLTLGEGIYYRTPNPGGTETAGSSGLDLPRKTGNGLPWDL
jgi:hypothetical protein